MDQLFLGVVARLTILHTGLQGESACTDIVQSSSSFKIRPNGNPSDLTPFDITCPDGHFISQYQLVAVPNADDTYNYTFGCCKAQSMSNCKQTASPEFSTSSDTPALIGLPVACDRYNVLTKFQLKERSGDLFYDYTCCSVPSQGPCTAVYAQDDLTPIAEALRHHNIECNSDSPALNTLRPSTEHDKMPYRYLCCPVGLDKQILTKATTLQPLTNALAGAVTNKPLEDPQDERSVPKIPPDVAFTTTQGEHLVAAPILAPTLIPSNAIASESPVTVTETPDQVLENQATSQIPKLIEESPVTEEAPSALVVSDQQPTDSMTTLEPAETKPPKAMFVCDSGEKLDMYYRCNGFEECDDGSDEVGCSYEFDDDAKAPSETTETTQVLTQIATQAPALPPLVVGYQMPPDPVKPVAKPNKGVFMCRSGEIILRRHRCNGIEECMDGTDESGCPQNNVMNRPKPKPQLKPKPKPTPETTTEAETTSPPDIAETTSQPEIINQPEEAIYYELAKEKQERNNEAQPPYYGTLPPAPVPQVIPWGYQESPQPPVPVYVPYQQQPQYLPYYQQPVNGQQYQPYPYNPANWESAYAPPPYYHSINSYGGSPVPGYVSFEQTQYGQQYQPQYLYQYQPAKYK